MSLHRRQFLQKALAAISLLAVPKALWASSWPVKAFEAKKRQKALQSLFGSSKLLPSDAITLKVPEIAENGKVVPVTVSTTLLGVDKIAIIVDKNPQPLTASFDLGLRAVAEVSTRIKMQETSTLLAVVSQKGKLYSTEKQIKVTIGGCGG